MARVAILDYGTGNIFSLKKALERCGADVDIIYDMDSKNEHSGILLPGVGNFDPAIKNMRKSRLSLAEFADSAPVLGICLGMEVFFERSDEGQERGLGIMEGDVVSLPDTMTIPHMGWNNIQIKRETKFLEGIEDGSWAYFVHSFMARTASDDIVMADSEYGMDIPVVVQKDNFIGTQFHPEKSGSIGRMMLENFLEECKR